MKTTSTPRRLATAAIILCLLAGIAATQMTLTSRKGPEWSRENLSFLPQSDRLAPFLLGFQTTYANYLWIKTVLYYGGHSESDKQYPMLITMTDMVTRLNPRFYPAYEFAGLMLPDHTENPQAARVILERGIASFGTTKWKLPFYLGNLYGQDLDDNEMAAFWMERAGEIKNAPSYTRALAAKYHTAAANTEMAKIVLAALIESSESPQVKEYLRRKLRALEVQGDSGQQSAVKTQ